MILRVWRNEKEALFQVEDTGIGISQQQLPLLFETFQQLENSRQRTYSGTGLGLALTKQLVELHRGIIEVESTPAKGSIFTVWLPIQPNIQSRINSDSGVISQYPSKSKTIVLINKNEEVATLICELLTAADYQVVWLIDDSTAIHQIELLQPSIVILDQQLPQIYHISKTLKKSQPTKSIQILLLSSKMTANNWKKISNHGIDDYLIKSIQPTHLLQKISKLMSK